MPFTTQQRTDFDAAIQALRDTPRGQEATMYGHLRDIFVDVLGYARTAVVTDTAGARGRPDLTVYAQGGAAATRVSWIVVEAKDEHNAAADPVRRVGLFAEKAKYITADTAFFVMIDPVMFVIRGVGAGQKSAADIEIPLAGLTIDDFAGRAAPLRAEFAGVPRVLQAFREGDESLIACDPLSYTDTATDAERLAVQISQNVFFDVLSETTRLLQQATLQALREVRPERDDIRTRVDEFAERYGGYRFEPYPIAIEGTGRRNREADQAHRRESALLRRYLVQRPALSRLTLHALPRFAERSGLTDIDKIERFFANETANLILARILLIRFLEDHGFFDVETPDGIRHRRFLCNGGVAAFQGMKAYFDYGYTRLLEEAYRTGGHFYSAAFDETEMDWVIALSDANLSRMIEWTLFRLSRFNFSTARGDLMTGVYDRFLDRGQRKEQGEFYTPPSIARYILERVNVPDTAEVLDPACGSGTFLIERYRQTIGEDADRGLATYAEARDAVERLCGNDINPFSAVLTQIQILWHLLAFGDDIRHQGFPDLRIAERANSLNPDSLHDPMQTRFGEIDRSGYEAVIGNPPYIRSERANDVERHAQEYFETPRERNGTTFPGISVGGNAYTLFIYRALDHWCRQPTPDDPTGGKLGFIVPLSFCGAKEAADLRRLFQPGGRWAIREIVDLEIIWRDIFDADVLPAIVIMEAKSAQEDDIVSIRLADETCVQGKGQARRPTFRFDHLPEQPIRYADLFSPDGRILTRLTPKRVELIRKLRANATFQDAAMPFWTRRSGRGPMQVSATRPTGIGEAQWSAQRLIREGCALRREVHYDGNGGGHTIYKGENIVSCGFVGNTVHENLDVSRASSPSIWAYQGILPQTVYAIPLIAQVPIAAPFNPTQVAVLNTAVVFAPRPDLADVPFDILLLSTVYSFFYVVAGRRSFQNKIRSHVYTSVVSELPWNEALADQRQSLCALRTSLLDACERRHNSAVRLAETAVALGLRPLREVVRARAGSRLIKGPGFATEPEVVLGTGALEIKEVDGEWRVHLDDGGEHYIAFDAADLADLAKAGFAVKDGEQVSWNAVLTMPVPVDPEMARRLDELRATFEPRAIDEEIERIIADLDLLVGGALGLTLEEIEEIRRDMAEDPFLSKVQPRLPLSLPRQRGRRIPLEREHRYASV